MREIKFRAWDEIKNEKGKMHYFDKMTMCDNGLFFGNSNFDLDENHNDDKNAVIMQFTGLKDKNGKDIYDSDLLKGFGKLWIVNWQNEEARFLLLPSTGNSDSWKFMDEVNIMEIVGNIYEPPTDF